MRRTMLNDPPLKVALGLAASGIPVVPLHHPVAAEQGEEIRWGLASCSCGRLDCPQACAHPLYGNEAAGSVDPNLIAQWWACHPQANIGVQTGQTCDVLETSRALGQLMLRLLDRAGQPRPPVSLPTGGRWQWWMAATLGLPTYQFFLGNPPEQVEVRILGRDGLVVAPPSRLVNGDHILWLHQLHNKLPSATLLLQTLLDAHQQLAQSRLGPPSPATPPVVPSPRRAGSPHLIPART